MQILTARLYRLQQRTLLSAENIIAALNPRPNPASVPFATYDPQRQFACRKYSLCLDVAFGSDWAGFTCSGCRAYERLTREEERADIEAMARLLAAFCGERTQADRVDSPQVDDDMELADE